MHQSKRPKLRGGVSHWEYQETHLQEWAGLGFQLGAPMWAGKGAWGPCAGRGCLWSSRSQRQPPGRAAVAPGVKYVTAAWSIDHCYRGLWPKWKFMKNWWSPQIIFFPFSFRSAVPVQWGEIKWGVERFSGEEVVVQRSGGREIRPIFYLTFL